VRQLRTDGSRAQEPQLTTSCQDLNELRLQRQVRRHPTILSERRAEAQPALTASLQAY